MKDVLRAILYRRRERAMLTPIAPTPGGETPKTKDQPLFGLWKDREEMSDPAAYVRGLRRPCEAAARTGVKKASRMRKPK
jgi:hypothetical protein